MSATDGQRRPTAAGGFISPPAQGPTLHSGWGKEMKKMMMEILMLAVLVLLAVKKKQARWIQTTIDGSGGLKGAVDWLKSGMKIEPYQIESGTAKDFKDDGYTIPDFIDEDKQCLMLFVKDEMARPIIIHQGTALMTVAIWISTWHFDVEYQGDLDVFSITDGWTLTFNRGKKKFDPYTVKFDNPNV